MTEPLGKGYDAWRTAHPPEWDEPTTFDTQGEWASHEAERLNKLGILSPTVNDLDFDDCPEADLITNEEALQMVLESMNGGAE